MKPARRLESRPRASWQATQRREKELQSDVDQLAAERERLNTQLVETAKLIQRSEGAAHLHRIAPGRARGAGEDLRGSLNQRHGSDRAAAGRHAAHGPQPAARPHHPARGRPQDGAQRHAAGRRLPRARRPGRALADRLNELVRVMTEIRTQGDKLGPRWRGSPTRARGCRDCWRRRGVAGPAPVRVGQRAPGRSRDLRERHRPERADLAARQGGEGATPGSAAYEQEIAAAQAGGAATVGSGARTAGSQRAPPQERHGRVRPGEEHDQSIVLAPSGDAWQC